MATTRTTTRHVIVIQSADIHDGPVRIERLAGAAGILPGHLLTFSSGNVIVHGTADGNVGNKIVADVTMTPDTISNPTTAKIDLVYANGDTVYGMVASPGDVWNMWLAAGQTAVEGLSALVSNGDGTLKVVTVDASTLAGAIVGYPAEDVDNSGGGSAVRIAVRMA